jgi:hypothetical protein
MHRELTCYDPSVQARLCSRAARAPTEGVSRLTRDGHQFDLRPDAEESAPEIDLPLHDNAPESVIAPAIPSRTATPSETARSRGGVIAVAMLMIGLFAGGAVGFMAGQRMAPPSPTRAVEAAPPAAVESVEDARPPDEPGTPRDYTSVERAGTIAPPSAAEAARAPRLVTDGPDAPAPAPPGRQDAPNAAGSDSMRPAAAASRAATVQFASRPGGAVVYMGDRRLGSTPFTVRDVTPGTYRIRMELAGHQPWTTTVAVEPGADVRVGASLE